MEHNNNNMGENQLATLAAKQIIYLLSGYLIHNNQTAVADRIWKKKFTYKYAWNGAIYFNKPYWWNCSEYINICNFFIICFYHLGKTFTSLNGKYQQQIWKMYNEKWTLYWIYLLMRWWCLQTISTKIQHAMMLILTFCSD